MTMTQWARALRALREKHSAKVAEGCELTDHGNGYYSLADRNRNCIICTWNLDAIRDILVDRHI